MTRFVLRCVRCRKEIRRGLRCASCRHIAEIRHEQAVQSAELARLQSATMRKGLGMIEREGK